MVLIDCESGEIDVDQDMLFAEMNEVKSVVCSKISRSGKPIIMQDLARLVRTNEDLTGKIQ